MLTNAAKVCLSVTTNASMFRAVTSAPANEAFDRSEDPDAKISTNAKKESTDAATSVGTLWEAIDAIVPMATPSMEASSRVSTSTNVAGVCLTVLLV